MMANRHKALGHLTLHEILNIPREYVRGFAQAWAAQAFGRFIHPQPPYPGALKSAIGAQRQPFTLPLRGTIFLLAGCVALLLTACHANEGAVETPVKESARASQPARIDGQVLLQGQDDASGIQVYIPGTSLISMTNEEGHFSLEGVGPGTYDVDARADGFVPARIGQVTVAPSNVSRQYALASVTLKPRVKSAATTAGIPGSIQGKVSSAIPAAAGERDWSQCSISLEKTPYRTTCDADGEFLLWSLPPDQYSMVVRLAGFEPGRVAVRVLPGPEPTKVEVQLQPAAESLGGTRQIQGSVELFGPDGGPTNDFDRITVTALNRTGVATGLNPDGSFTLANLAPAKYLISASGAGYTPPNPVAVDLTSATEQTIQLTLHAVATTSNTTGRIHGVALKNGEAENQNGGITVALAGTSFVAMTDETGQFSIGNIPPGAYKIVAQANGYISAEQGPIQIKAADDVTVNGLLLEQAKDYPVVLHTDPGDGSRDFTIQHEMPVTIRFSKKMNQDTLANALHIDPPVAYRIQPGSETDAFHFVLFGFGEQPVARYKTRYTITMDENAADFENLHLQEPFTMNVTTGSPRIIGTDPSSKGLKAENGLTKPVAIFFNAPLDHQSIGNDVVRISPNSPITPIISLEDAGESGWTTIYVGTALQPDTQYRITVASRLRTTGNVAIANIPYTFTFRTAKLYLPPAQQGAQPIGR